MFYVCIAHCMRKSTKCQNVEILVSSCGALYLHSNMTEQRLSALALLHIHHDTSINIPEIVRELDATGTRRIAVLHTPDVS